MSEVKHDTGQVNLLDRMIIHIGNGISIFYFIGVVITVYEVFLRYIFNQPTIWVHETTLFLVGLAMLYGGSYCMANDGHIKVSFIRDAMPKMWQKINDFIVALLTFAFTTSLIYAGWIMTKKALWAPSGIVRLERSGTAWNPPAPAILKTFLLIVVVLIAIQAFIQLLKVTKKLAVKGESQ